MRFIHNSMETLLKCMLLKRWGSLFTTFKISFKRFKNSWEVYGYLAKKINKEFHKRAMEKIKIFIDNAWKLLKSITKKLAMVINVFL